MLVAAARVRLHSTYMVPIDAIAVKMKQTSMTRSVRSETGADPCRKNRSLRTRCTSSGLGLSPITLAAASFYSSARSRSIVFSMTEKVTANSTSTTVSMDSSATFEQTPDRIHWSGSLLQFKDSLAYARIRALQA